jgi:hypothetical protein
MPRSVIMPLPLLVGRSFVAPRMVYAAHSQLASWLRYVRMRNITLANDTRHVRRFIRRPINGTNGRRRRNGRAGAPVARRTQRAGGGQPDAARKAFDEGGHDDVRYRPSAPARQLVFNLCSAAMMCRLESKRVHTMSDLPHLLQGSVTGLCKTRRVVFGAAGAVFMGMSVFLRKRALRRCRAVLSTRQRSLSTLRRWSSRR